MRLPINMTYRSVYSRALFVDINIILAIIAKAINAIYNWYMDDTMTDTTPQKFTNFIPSWYQRLSNNAARVRNTVKKFDIAAITTGHKIKISLNSHRFLEKLSPYQRVQISRKIASFSPTPRPGDASAQKNADNIYSVTEINTGFTISYKVHAATVYILEIVPSPKLKGAGKELPTLYYIKLNAVGDWESKQVVT